MRIRKKGAQNGQNPSGNGGWPAGVHTKLAPLSLPPSRENVKTGFGDIYGGKKRPYRDHIETYRSGFWHPLIFILGCFLKHVIMGHTA